MTTGDELVLLDTNVLIAATDEGRSDHVQAQTVLTDWPAAGSTLYTTGQILREYLVVVTRPADQNGLGISQEDALFNIRSLSERLRFIGETEKVHHRVLSLLDEIPCSGKQIHDTNIVATALTHGVTTIVTRNTSDFARYREHLTIKAL